MSYENRFSLKIIELPDVEMEIKECGICGHKYNLEDSFCRNDLSKLVTIKKSATQADIISQFKVFSDDGYLISSGGGSASSGNGRSIESDLIRFSKALPDLVFQLDVEWESGLGDNPQRVYIKNGKSKKHDAIITFADYKEEDLK